VSNFLPLYKFREVTDRSLDSISNNTLWFSYVDDFNDPFELFYNLSSGVDVHNFSTSLEYFIKFAYPQNEIFNALAFSHMEKMSTAEKERMLKSLVKALMPVHNDALQRLKSGIKIFSLSKTNRHPLLWGHYADGLKGMCIEYDFNKQTLPLNIGYCSVAYTDKPFLLNLQEMLKCKKQIHDYSEQIYATKNVVWNYEEELRLISDDKVMKGNSYQLSDTVIRSICIGEKMPIEDQLKIKEVIKGRGIKLFKAIAIPSEFKIDIVEYEI